MKRYIVIIMIGLIFASLVGSANSAPIIAATAASSAAVVIAANNNRAAEIAREHQNSGCVLPLAFAEKKGCSLEYGFNRFDRTLGHFMCYKDGMTYRLWTDCRGNVNQLQTIERYTKAETQEIKYKIILIGLIGIIGIYLIYFMIGKLRGKKK